MKNKRILILSIIINIILIVFICNFINRDIIREKQIVKEMSESSQVTDLNNQINSLNTEHTEYMNYIQTCKSQLASVISNEGVPTSEDDTFEKMVTNIGDIFTQRTKLDESVAATADNISEGKQAYVNGEKIIGTKVNNISNLKLVEVGSKISDATGNDESWSFNPTKTDVYLIVQTASGGNTSCYINNISGNIKVLWQEYHVRNNYDGYAIRITLAQLTANNPITMVARAGGNCRYIYRKVYSISL